MVVIIESDNCYHTIYFWRWWRSELIPETPEYKAGVLITQSQHFISVSNYWTGIFCKRPICSPQIFISAFWPTFRTPVVCICQYDIIISIIGFIHRLLRLHIHSAHSWEQSKSPRQIIFGIKLKHMNKPHVCLFYSLSCHFIVMP